MNEIRLRVLHQLLADECSLMASPPVRIGILLQMIEDEKAHPEPCSDCQRPIDPTGPSLCMECLEKHAAALILRDSQHECDICDTIIPLRNAGEITVTCRECFATTPHTQPISILDAVD